MTLDELRKWANTSKLENLDTSKEWIPINNRTRAYLLPCLKFHGAEFNKKINEFSFFAAGTHDENRKPFYKDTLTLLFNINTGPINFDIPNLVDEYFYGELVYGKLHAMVISIPEEFSNAVEYFKRGEYSKMYTNPHKIFGKASKTSKYFNSIREKCSNVCTKDPVYRKSLNKVLGITMNENKELDSIPNPLTEIFNFLENNPDYEISNY